jgi:polysaccharide biosynthesis/export protein
VLRLRHMTCKIRGCLAFFKLRSGGSGNLGGGTVEFLGESVRLLLRAAVAGVAAALGGCFLPADGPYGIDVYTHNSDVKYALVDVTPPVIYALAQYEPSLLAGAFTDRKPPSRIRFGIGDVVSITVFEAAPGGLFIPIEAGVRPGNFVNLPDQIVDNNGNITFPYAGTIRAAGRINVEIQDEIISKIKNRAVEPQVIVVQSQQRTSLISVVGDVNNPIRYPAAYTGAQDRVLDAITRAGGIKSQGYEEWVMIERNGRRATVPFANLVFESKNNIFVQPGDRIYVYKEQQKFMAFGAVGQNFQQSQGLEGQGQYTFDDGRINLGQAVAKTGGLNDTAASARSVFLFRREPREVAATLGIDCAPYPDDLVPVVFHINFQDPGAFFLATSLQMRNGDVIFVANAASVEITKFAAFVGVLAATTNVGLDSVLIAKQLR